ncbi:unnamed protein product [Medioppia subpectinata]|uniref:BHLH domain-containing protein n=1 Tax=Medioppia subpectinata TaxID=1979941 RepID=A0A7R9L076_9ACAR|nr:unnamed protein product [Medioppia subpectinata]CAG2112861.1 unnamed protein product [Medioppia subpectinata]
MNQMYSNQSSQSGSMEMVSSGPNTDCSLTTDEDDSDGQKSSLSYKERRREAHTQAEQKRRDAIKRGYEDLQHLVPACSQYDSTTSYKLSKAAILSRSIEHMNHLAKDMSTQEKELQRLRKEVVANQIMKNNYEKMVKAHQQSQPGHQSDQISDSVKLAVFEGIFDNLFQSFDKSVEVADFNQLSDCTINWVEKHCKPETLQQMVVQIMKQNHITN